MASNGSGMDFVPGESCFNLNFSNPGGLAFAAASPAPSDDGSSSGHSDSLPPSTDSPKANGKPKPGQKPAPYLPNGKKTKGRVKIKMEFIDNKLRRYTTFSKRKTGIMKKAYELSTLTGTQVMLLVASETGHVYTFATKKLQPMITSEAGKQLISTCLNSPDEAGTPGPSHRADSLDPPSTPKSNASAEQPRQKGKSKASPSHNSSAKSGRYFGALPTMVPLGGGSEASEGAGEEGQGEVGSGLGFASDDSEDEGPSGSQPQVLLEPKAEQMAQLVPSVGPSGTLMYQMPQGVVYTAGEANGQQPLCFNIATSAADGQAGSQAPQQFITIPFTQMLAQMIPQTTAVQSPHADNDA